MIAKRPLWLGGLPHQFRRQRYIPEAWYAYRLGLIDANGDVVDRERMDAVDAFIREVVDDVMIDGSPARPAAAFFRPIRGPRKDSGIPPPQNVGQWSWTPPLVADWTEGKQRFPTCLIRRHILGHWWRGRVGYLFRRHNPDPGPDFGEEMLDGSPLTFYFLALCNTLEKVGRADPLWRAVLGPDYTGKVPEPQHLRLPRADRWWWCARSAEGVRAVVVDVDCKTESDRLHFEARMRVLLGSGMPRPHLIVTSKGGGRHLWYLVEERARMGGGFQGNNVGRYARAFKDRLTELGVHVGERAIEVFPSGETRKGKLPPIPFGDRSYLCDRTSMRIVARSPMNCIERWYKRMQRHPLVRLSRKAFSQASIADALAEDLTLVAKPPPSIAASGQARVLPRDDEPRRWVVKRSKRQEARHLARLRAKRPSIGGGSTVEDGRALFERGAEAGTSHADTKIVTRFIKHHLHGAPFGDRMYTPNARDRSAFHGWVSKHPRYRQERAHLEGRFPLLYKTARRLSSASQVPTLTDADLLHVVRVAARVCEGKTDPRYRAGVIIVHAVILGLARTAAPDTTGWTSVRLPVLQLKYAWREENERYRALLEAHKVIAPEERRDADDREVWYRLKLPQPDGSPVRLGGPADIAVLMQRTLSSEQLRRLFPTAPRERWMRTFQTKSVRTVVDELPAGEGGMAAE